MSTLTEASTSTNNQSPAPTSTPQASGVSPVSNTGGAQLPSLGEKWYESLSEELRTEPSLRNITNVENLAKSYVHAQKAIGADKVVLPSKHATEQDWRQFWNKVGLPDKLEEYKIEPPKGATINEDFFKQTKEQLYKAGVMPKQANELVNWWLSKEQEFQKASEETKVKQVGEYEKAIKEEWGQAFDKKISEARQVIKHINDPELNKVLDETGLGSHPAVIKAFQKLGTLLKEDGVVQPSNNYNVRSPAEAQKELNMIMGNYAHPYFDASHPNHKAAVEEVLALNQQIVGSADQT